MWMIVKQKTFDWMRIMSPKTEARYSFVRNRTSLKKFRRLIFYFIPATLILLFSLVVFPFMLIPGLDAERTMKIWFSEALLQPRLWSLLILCLIVLIGMFLYFWNQRIVIDRKGIALQGFLFQSMEEYYGWHEFVQIYRATLPRATGAFGANGRHVIALIDRYGKSFLLPSNASVAPNADTVSRWASLAAWYKKLHQPKTSDLLFLGEGHPHSLLEAIEKFYGPVGTPDKTVARKIPALSGSISFPGIRWNIDVTTGRLAHVIIAASFVVMASAYIDFNVTSDFFSLEGIRSDNIRYLICWISSGLAFALAWRYLKREKSREGALVLSVMFAGSLVVLMMPLVTALPLWFGTEEQETFVLKRPTRYGKTQEWRAVATPEKVYFLLEIARDRRKYNEPGTEHEFTLYRGPFGLRSMRFGEQDALFLKNSDDDNPQNP
jgi:hypothetical protein